MNLFYTFTLFLISIHLNFGKVKGTDDFPWAWKCHEPSGTCIKTDKTLIRPEQKGTPLSICKLNCGKHGVLWPIPTGKVELGKDVVRFVPLNVRFTSIHSEDSIVKQMLQNATSIFKKYLNQMHPDYALTTAGNPTFNSTHPSINKVDITIATVWNDKVNTLSTDESYVVSIGQNQEQTIVTVTIIANTFFGARHGLETLSQLITYDEDTNTLVIVKTGTITDSPVFPYRGILIDTSRNFFSLKSIRRLIDGMSYTKLNILHWHITDTHSFPFYSITQPEMSQYGAYSKRKIYKPEDIKDLIAYARIRGVKIVPEFDEPAHTGNGWQWGPSKGLGNLAVCINQEPWESYCVEPPCGQLNVVNDNMYDVLGNIFKDLFDIFDHDIFHMGGDEININCWNTTKEITDWMKNNKLETTHDGFLQLWNRFQTKAYEKVKIANGGLDVPSILWTSELTHSDVIEKYLNNSRYIIQIWTKGDDKLIPFLISKNYRIILSNYDAWYLDCGYGAWVGGGPNNWCSPYIGWQQVYSNNPINILANTTSIEEAQKAIKAGLVLGGISPMWSEQVDEESIEGKVWPRGAALGERLWSNPITGWDKAETRMIHTRQRYVERGLHPDRLQPEWCHQNEALCYLK